jgi:hypothetical protein
MEEKKQPRKYQRREFIKAGAKVGAGTALGGGLGYLTGKTYKAGRDFYREDIKPIGDAINPTMEKLGETKERLGDWWDKYVKGKQEEPKEPEKTSRRRFLSKYFHIFNEHPVGTGTVTGVALGGLVSSLKLYPQYIQKKNIAKLKDEHIDYEERIKILEEYKKELEKASTEKDKKIMGLEGEVYQLKKIYEKLNMNEKDSSGLEDKLEEDNLESPVTMFVSGMFLLILLTLINGINYTGFFTFNKVINPSSNFLGIILLFTSLALIIIGGLRLIKISKKNRKLLKYKLSKEK